jgi:NAD(P)-dependent dehydrogenase (short-subunit alcohol dehydrogenase family)
MSIAQIFDVSGKVAFVTGAGSGIGREMAVAMAENGASVVCFDINAKGLAETAKLTGINTLLIEGDVSD